MAGTPQSMLGSMISTVQIVHCCTHFPKVYSAYGLLLQTVNVYYQFGKKIC